MKVVKDENNEQNLSMNNILNLTPDEDGRIELTQEQMAEMFGMPQQNPYTHELDFSNIKTTEDVIEVLKSLKISVDPAQWEQDSKYIKLKGE